ncbi:MAG: TonB C-terminal domain-containing protein, partial [Desulfovibrio sp.]|nr:TonB C-terminal domain-containing protein [Desulfovibrio sp.]
VEQALAQARRRAGGNRGGGGGEGEGPGGGGLGDVYMGQVMLAVRPNWGFASAGRINLRCVVNVKVDAQGKVQQTTITRSSGNAQFDASAVNAIVRTSQSGDFPPPPSSAYGDLDLVFTLDEMMGR